MIDRFPIFARPAAALVLVGLLWPLAATAQGEASPTQPTSPQTANDSANSDNASDGPPVPVLAEGDRVYVAPEIRSKVDAGRLRDCMAELTAQSPVYANFYAYLMSTDAQPELAEVDSINGYADHVWKTWKLDGAVDTSRGVLLVKDIEREGISVHVGSRWKKADFFETYVQSPIRFLGKDPVKRVCKTARHVDEMMGGILEDDRLRSRLDVHARLNLAENRSEKALDRATELQQRARELAGADSQLATAVDTTLKLDATRKKIRERLAAVRRFVDEDSKLTRGEAHGTLMAVNRTVEGQVRRNAAASNDVQNFAIARRDVESRRDELETLREQIRARQDRDWVWMGADEARATADTCASRIQKAHSRLEAGKIVDSGITADVPPCFGRIEAQLEDGDPLNFFLVRVLPTLAVVLVVSSIGFVGWRTVKTKSEKEFEAAEQVEDWDQTLEMAEMRLRPLRENYGRFIDGGQPPESLGSDNEIADETLVAMRKAGKLVDVLRVRHAEARKLVDEAGRFSFRAVDRAHELLNDEPIEFSVADPTGDGEAAIDYSASPSEALEELERLVDAARETVRET